VEQVEDKLVYGNTRGQGVHEDLQNMKTKVDMLLAKD
jgi:hypothetical protein